MNKNELLWKYIDGDCTPEEAAKVEQWLDQDPAFKAEWAKAVKLQQALQQQELEQPSMRFSKNLMERLPQLYGKIGFRPLIAPLWRKVFAGIMGLASLGYFMLVIASIDWNNPGSLSPDSGLSQFVEALTSLPMQVMSLAFALSLSYIFLTAIDRQLKKRFD